jgi:HxlR-like helix-turn-helix
LGWVVHDRPLSQKVLTETLARMQRDGLVAKIERSSAFGYTWYQLTPVGRACSALRPLARWADPSLPCGGTCGVQGVPEHGYGPVAVRPHGTASDRPRGRDMVSFEHAILDREQMRGGERDDS